jgi:Tol biopolymer transport system component/DNA-binding winged helix-turn-helix (wHTH) protein
MNASPHIFSSHFLDAASVMSNLRLRVGEHVVDLGALRVVTRPDAARLTSKAAAVLLELARHAGDTVTRDQLLDRVWKDRVTTPDVLTQAIKELRRAFADDARPPRYIETIPKVGYRLLAAVSQVDGPAAPATLVHGEPRFENDAANTEFIADDDAHGANMRTALPARPWRWIAAAAVALLIGAIAVIVIIRPAPVSLASAGAWKATNIRAITSDPGPERRPAVSPDGTRVAYSQLDPATNFERIVIRAVGQSQAIHLTTKATAHEEMPMWSPDGTRIAFERLGKDEVCTMYIAASLGGAESEVGSCGNYIVNYYAWSPDGKSLVTSDQQASASGEGLPLALIDLDTGKKRLLQYQRSDSDQDLEPLYSPDGRWIAFRRGLSPHSDLYLMHAEGGAARQLTHLDSRIVGTTWTRDSAGLILSSDPDGALALFLVAIDDGHMSALNVSPAAYPDAARSGDTVVYEIPRTKNTLAEVTIGEQLDSPKLLAQSTGSDEGPTFSPDGKQFAFVSNRNGSQQVWLDARDGTEPLALTDFRNAAIWDTSWNADGKRLLATVRVNGKSSLVQIDLASRRRQAVAVSQSVLLTGGYGPDPESYLLIRRAANARGELILLQNADSPQEKVVSLASAVEHFELDAAARMIYYAKADGSGVFRRDLAGGAEQLMTKKGTANAANGWRVVDGRIWYVTGMMLKPFDLREFDPATGADRALVRVNAWLRDVNFSVAPSRDRVLFAPMGPEDIDVGAFDLVATGKH